MLKLQARWAGALCGVAAAALAACDDGASIEEPVIPESVDLAVCAPDRGPFTVDIDNPYFPLPVGRELVLEGEDEEGVLVRVELEVLDVTEEIAGVTIRVVAAEEFEDGELIETVRDFYAQAPDGTVCYYGEDVNQIEDGEIIGHEGAWRAGENGNLPGIIMPGSPRPGTQFPQERAPGVAEDMSAVVAVGVPVTVPAASFADTAYLLDWNPLEGDTILDGEAKVYARGVGLVVDDFARLVSQQ